MQPPWYQRHAVLLCLGVFLLIQWGAWQLLPDPANTWIYGGEVADDVLKAAKLEGIQINADSNQYITTTEQAQITWHPGSAAGLLSFSLTITIEGVNTASQWELQYTTQQEPFFDEGMIRTRSLRPILINRGKEATLSWNLPVAAKNIRLLVPPNTKFSAEIMYLAGIFPDQSTWNTWRQALKLLCLAINLSLLVAWFAQYLPQLRRILAKPACISVLLLGIHGSIMIWLLPPFQGPDENRHWREAVKLFRSDGQPDSILFQLPNILDAEAPRWQSQIPFHAANLHASANFSRERGETKGAPYVKHWGYPTVGLIAFLSPPIQTVPEALTFYYCCRATNLLLLLGLVAASWRYGLGSWTLVTFLSFPLVLQQCTIISTDTIHNLGTLLAVLLFCRHQRVRTTLSWLLLGLVSCLVVASKPPAYLLILLLPAWFIPWSTLRRPRVWLPLALSLAAISAVAFWFLWGLVVKEGQGMSDLVHKQLDYVLTGPGFTQFAISALEYPTRFLVPFSWWEPLGWLDTNLNDLHRALLWLSLIAAVIFDVARWIIWLRTNPIQSLWHLVTPLLLCMVHLLFVWWSLALIMYLTISDYQATGITGLQVRYMIPVALLFLAWPPACLTSISQMPLTQRPLWPAITLLLLAITRVIQLAIDLHYRYWA